MRVGILYWPLLIARLYWLPVVAFCLGTFWHPTHDCPVTVEYVASDTIPSVTKGWVIEGDSVREVVFDDDARIGVPWASYWLKEVYADRTLAEAELCRRLDAQAEQIREKREGLCD